VCWRKELFGIDRFESLFPSPVDGAYFIGETTPRSDSTKDRAVRIPLFFEYEVEGIGTFMKGGFQFRFGVVFGREAFREDIG
jgi:hypothetical protein